MKRILITGKNSYVGVSLQKWLSKYPDSYSIDAISLRGSSWREKNFSSYDVVIHMAGIAHVSTDPKLEDIYYKVNRDLTIETAKKAKKEGVQQFIFMSSIIVYGDGSNIKRIIDKNTVPSPSNFYGNSKLQAEEGIKAFESDTFKVVIVRPPMIYGKGSKGNYLKLARAARKLPLFPYIHNERSMLHIDNLNEFLKLVIDNKESGLFFPQNAEYVNTSELVREISQVHGQKIWMTKLFNPLIKIMFGLNFVNKVFGNLVYEQSMSNYGKQNYRVRSFKESVELTELGVRSDESDYS